MTAPGKFTPGQHLQAIHAAFFNGGGWVEPFTWDDYDEAGRERWEAFAGVIGRNIATSAAAPDLLAFAKAHEAWEALLIAKGDWERTGDGLPTFTDEIYERFMELQALRNSVMAKATGDAK